MNIKYAGPRPIISQHGVEFKDGKEDKYVYLIIGIQILQAIDKNYEERKAYSYDATTKRVSDRDMLEVMHSYDTTIEEDVLKEEQAYEIKIAQEIETVKNRSNLKDIEKKIWIKNLEIMKKYRIQRAINKIYYMHCINEIKEVIKREQIKEIDTPFYEKYWHVLETIRGSLEAGRHSVNTDLKIETLANGDMMARLFIEY